MTDMIVRVRYLTFECQLVLLLFFFKQGKKLRCASCQVGALLYLSKSRSKITHIFFYICWCISCHWMRCSGPNCFALLLPLFSPRNSTNLNLANNIWFIWGTVYIFGIYISWVKDIWMTSTSTTFWPKPLPFDPGRTLRAQLHATPWKLW